MGSVVSDPIFWPPPALGRPSPVCSVFAGQPDQLGRRVIVDYLGCQGVSHKRTTPVIPGLQARASHVAFSRPNAFGHVSCMKASISSGVSTSMTTSVPPLTSLNSYFSQASPH